MSDRMQNPDHLRNVAYRDSSRLDARTKFWMRFGLNADQWYGWYYGLFSPPAAARILEVGCGPGGMWDWGFTNGLVSPSWDVTLTDLSEGMLANAREALATTDNGFTYGIADVCDLPYDEGTFDVVVANYMLYHAADTDLAVSEIKRVLKPEGTLYAATNSSGHIKQFVDLQKKFAAEPDEAAYAGSAHEPFTLENGPQVLNKHFRHVSVHSAESIAEADDVSLLVRFVESMDVAVDVDRMSDYLQSYIDSYGHFPITRSSGLFVATNKATIATA